MKDLIEWTTNIQLITLYKMEIGYRIYMYHFNNAFFPKKKNGNNS